ncbi:glucose-6-phosphate isomerase [Oricola cellulosilytica]|uniref:Glucose-6-phosphate isomerase n=1 Tax=Oricola cellulosilytica TaxID=1429082 RepID=A0A4R0PF45_9HYPH|nr:glucose-6-phosphate isomerase [Oricola cellulosilytica]TCD16447.1 glucose-6-phosphate isomerase [Oricola cellulosilytica]
MPSKTEAIAALRAHASTGAPNDMRAAFASDEGRFAAHHAVLDDMLLDWSKCRVNTETLGLLEALAAASKVEERRDRMFAGERINATEDRAVLHTALRNRSGEAVTVDGSDVMSDVNAVLAAMADFSHGIRAGTLTGSNGGAITDVVNIGIGGSDLGPAMAVLALAPYHDGPGCHFVSNVDGAHIADTLDGLDPATTLFIVASKTFTTIETMTNAKTARSWVVNALGEAAVSSHFCAVSTALDKVDAFGIPEDRIFGFWDWVGGRYSLWSAIGLPLMLAIGPEKFGDFLSGGYAMDRHFREAPTRENLPMMLGLIGYWHRAICDYPSRAVIPYDQRLARLPVYLQQLDMESNGKGVTVTGEPVDGVSGPVVWGEPGTNGQHAFFQLIHQGTDIIPVEFLVAANSHEPGLRHHHDLLLANCFAQSAALMAGRTLEEAKAQMASKGVDGRAIDEIAPHRVFSGNRPSLTLVYDKLDPFTLGRIIALYEHRVFVEAQLYGINAFDQWGVELGKELATALLPVVETGEGASERDGSTAALVAHARSLSGK